MDFLARIVEMLPELTPEELGQLKARLNSLSQFPVVIAGPLTGRSRSGKSDEAVWILEIISSTLRSLGAGGVSVKRMQASSDMGPFCDKLPDLLEYLDQVDQNKIYRQSLMTVGVKLLYLDLKKMNVPISATVVMRHIHRLPSVFDQHFPGYARFGMLGWIIRSQTGNSHVRKESHSEEGSRRRTHAARGQG